MSPPFGPLAPKNFLKNGGSSLKNFSILRVPYDFTIRTIKASPRCGDPRILLLVVAGLALIKKILRVQADLWIVAVLIIQPDLMVDNEPRLLTTDLTGPAVHGFPLINEGLPCPPPGSGLVELFLGHLWPSCMYAVPELRWRSCSYREPLFTGRGLY